MIHTRNRLPADFAIKRLVLVGAGQTNLTILQQLANNP